MGNNSLKLWMITSYSDSEISAFLNLCQEIEEALDITVETKLITWNRAYGSLIDAFKDGNPPDVFALGSTWIHTFARLGYLAPLPKDVVLPHCFVPWMEECAHYMGTKYAVPWCISPLVLAAHKGHLEKYGITPNDLSDWTSFKNTCERIGNENSQDSISHIPFAFPVKPEMNILHFFSSFLFKSGWEFPHVMPGDRQILDNQVFSPVFQYILHLMNISMLKKPHDLHMLSKILYDKFYRQGECTFYMDSGNSIIADHVCGLIRNEPRDGHITLFPLPSCCDEPKTYAGGGLFVVSSSCSHKRMAWEVVQYFIRDHATEVFTATSGNLPAYQCKFWQKYGQDPLLHLLYNESKHSATYPFHPIWRSIELIMANEIYDFFCQIHRSDRNDTQKEIEKALEKMNESINQLLGIIWERSRNGPRNL